MHSSIHQYTLTWGVVSLYNAFSWVLFSFDLNKDIVSWHADILFTQTDQKIKNIFAGRAGQIAGSDPDYGIRDLYEAIAKGDYVSLYL